MMNTESPTKTDYQAAMLESLQKLSHERQRFDLYLNGMNPESVPFDLLLHTVADDKDVLLDICENTIRHLATHSDMVTPKEAAIGVYRLQTVVICSTTKQQIEINQGLARELKNGTSLPKAIHNLSRYRSSHIERIDDMFQRDVAEHGLRESQAQFILNQTRKGMPLIAAYALMD